MLLTLGAAYALLAAAYLGVQYLLGLRQRWFVAALARRGARRAACCCSSADDLESFAGAVLAVQAVGAALVLAAGRDHPHRARSRGRA